MSNLFRNATLLVFAICLTGLFLSSTYLGTLGSRIEVCKISGADLIYLWLSADIFEVYPGERGVYWTAPPTAEIDKMSCYDLPGGIIFGALARLQPPRFLENAVAAYDPNLSVLALKRDSVNVNYQVLKFSLSNLAEGKWLMRKLGAEKVREWVDLSQRENSERELPVTLAPYDQKLSPLRDDVENRISFSSISIGEQSFTIRTRMMDGEPLGAECSLRGGVQCAELATLPDASDGGGFSQRERDFQNFCASAPGDRAQFSKKRETLCLMKDLAVLLKACPLAPTDERNAKFISLLSVLPPAALPTPYLDKTLKCFEKWQGPTVGTEANLLDNWKATAEILVEINRFFSPRKSSP